VLAVLPAFVRQSDSAPVRDALAAALARILVRYRNLSAYSAQQCDITRATGIYLESLCNEHGVYKQDGESDDSLRARALTVPTLVTPAAVLAAANAILGAYTATEAQYAESILDRWYVTDGTLAIGIEAESLPAPRASESIGGPDELVPDAGGDARVAEPQPYALDAVIREATKVALMRALQETNGNCHRAAELLGVSRYTVYRMLNRYGLSESRPYHRHWRKPNSPSA